ncbi:MAG: winged helix DNA-binding domain-containing protein [Candidatus Heimdallarchaeaceae archaeon]
MKPFPLATINYFILSKHHLTPKTKIDNILQIAHDICGLHSTSQTTPYLSLFSRTNSFQKEDLEKEAYEKKNLGKIRCMRKTIFLLPKEVLLPLYAATKNLYSQRREAYLERLGMSLDEYYELGTQIEDILKGRRLSVKEIKEELKRKENVSAVVSLLCDQKKIIRNKPVKGWRDKRHTYSLFLEYFSGIDLEEYEEEESIEYLIRYYIERYGPVTEKDIVWWSGLKKTQILKALKKFENEIIRIRIEGINHEYLIFMKDKKKLERLKRDEEPIINFLPDLDPYLMGYKNRERYINQKHFDYVFDRSGNAVTSILLNGRVIGVWDFVSSKIPMIKIHLFEKQGENIKKKIITEAKKVGKFIFNEEVQIKECKEMKPLRGRIPGAVLVPLKNC